MTDKPTVKKLCVIYTGGTIGMGMTAQGLAPVAGKMADDLARFSDNLAYTLNLQEYDELIDSSCILPEHWQTMLNDIAAGLRDFDGVVVVHGTDTLAYTASVLHYALSGLASLQKPVIVTGAQLPLSAPNSDGWGNLSDAFAAACQPNLNGVFVVFNHLILRGQGVTKINCEHFRGFESPNWPVVAEMGLSPLMLPVPIFSDRQPFQVKSLAANLSVLVCWLTPGFSASAYGQLLQSSPILGAIIVAYGNGNAPHTPELSAGIRQVLARGGLAVVVTQCDKGSVEMGNYAAGSALSSAGAVGAGHQTIEAVYAQLSILLSEGLRGDLLRVAFLAQVI
ncbi:MAG: asparaginase [Neisseriaceae bacterium]|nr:asparaginase [Neisseriaceae bacterium]